MPWIPMQSATGRCPACGAPVPLSRALKRRNQPFSCLRCKRVLRVAKVRLPVAAGAFVLVSLASRLAGVLGLVGALVLVLLYDALTLRISLDEGENGTTA